MPSERPGPPRLTWALGLLGAFPVLLVAAIVVGGGRPAPEQGSAPTVLRLVGVASVLGASAVLVPGPAWREGAALAVAAVGLAVLSLTGDGGPDIGGGVLVLLCLAALVVVAVRLAGAVRAGQGR